MHHIFYFAAKFGKCTSTREGVEQATTARQPLQKPIHDERSGAARRIMRGAALSKTAR